MAFRGANNPKLVNVIVSQNRRTARNSTGIDDPVRVITSHLACKIASVRSSARAWSVRWESSCGFRPRTASASRSAATLRPSAAGPDRLAWMRPAPKSCRFAPNHALQALANLAGLGPVASKYAVESEELSGGLLHSCVDSIKGTLGGGGDEAKNEGSHRGDQPNANLHRISRLRSSQCSGKAVRNLIPKSAPTNVHVNTIIPTIVASTVLLSTFSGVLLLCLTPGRYTFHCKKQAGLPGRLTSEGRVVIRPLVPILCQNQRRTNISHYLMPNGRSLELLAFLVDVPLWSAPELTLSQRVRRLLRFLESMVKSFKP